uniref:Transmembrane protein putative n=1 Tax=Albugo laibachii Nc14 TaxID=890382 RepID=F0X089_9STRA|nr:transmembrane protein putative [Albugo laibachii Nc14]|eukprot:CCA27171.1 transmembrane protein putative [Albugo laibachii Nc14]
MSFVAPQGLTNVCADASFTAQPQNQIGTSPIRIRSLTQGSDICIEISFRPSEATRDVGWFAIGLSRSGGMVSSPPANVMMYQTSSGQVQSFLISSHSSAGVTPESDQSAFALHSKSNSSDEIRFRYQRTLQASKTSSVAIQDGDNNLIWAYDTTLDISGHSPGTYGTASYNFASGITSTISNASMDGYCGNKNCSAIFGGAVFAVILVLALFLRSIRGTATGKLFVHESIVQAPKSVTNKSIQKPHISLWQIAADLCYAEVVVLILVVAAAVALIASFSGNTLLITGQLAVFLVMFMLLPVARIPLWNFVFGTSFERMIKFHRWLGIMLLPIIIIHLVKAIGRLDDIFSTEKYGEVVPLYGFIAFCALATMSLLASEPIRRSLYKLFYFSHRVLGIVALVFMILHCPKFIGVALVVPLVLYVVGLLLRWYSCLSNKYRASVAAHEPSGTTAIMLETCPKTAKLASGMNPGSYFWVLIPAVSPVEWHPFSAIVVSDATTIGFCIKAQTNTGAYTSKLRRLAQKNEESLSIRLCGPYGNPTVNVNEYKTIILAAGGVGITPLLSLINQTLHLNGSSGGDKTSHARDIILVWSVRNTQDLLMVDAFLPATTSPPIGSIQQDSSVPELGAFINVSYNFYVSAANTDGVVTRSNCELLTFRPGRPILDEYLNTSRFVDGDVAVMACGPPTLIAEAQRLARSCDFPFHQETFSW